ncbi:MAG: hypothetical protein B6229_09370 [Spirochaetaceae bacterium 4572_7]|nr:MAG: hypothetical protein B6229_09370 [Spirochaetaceae bacterium 4572_7]
MKIELIDVRGFIPAIRGMRKSMQSEGDSYIAGMNCDEIVQKQDFKLMLKLVKSGDSHSAFMRMIQVWVDIKASRMWWHQWDKYKFQHFMYQVEERSMESITAFEFWRDMYKTTKDEETFLICKNAIPEGLLQSRMVNLNYQTLRTIYQDRQNHRLPEWKKLCEWIKTLPHSELITEEKINV